MTAVSAATSRFVPVGRLEDLPPGTSRAIDVEGRSLALLNDGGLVHAVDGNCPHAGGPLGQGIVGPGCVLTCPWHDAAFDASSGQVLRGPARKPLRTYQVKVAAGVVSVAFPSS